MALEPDVQRIALVDPTTAVGWSRWRELDERHSLAVLRANLLRLSEEDRIPASDVQPLAHMLLAALNEAALLVGEADDRRAAAGTARAAVDTLLERLCAPGS